MDAVKARVAVLHNHPDLDEPADAGVLREAEDVDRALRTLGYESERVPVDRDSLFPVLDGLRGRRADTVVFNLCEGLEGSARFESTVAGLLELLGLRFTGSPSLTLSYALDKRVTKAVLDAVGVPTPPGRVYRMAPRVELVGDLAFPQVVKPLREDASIGVTRASYVTTAQELCRRVAEIVQGHRQPALVEPYLRGREFSVSVLGEGREARALPVAEMEFVGYGKAEPRLVTHQAKWDEGSEADRRTTPRCPAEAEPSLATRLVDLALVAFRALECRDYARVDLRLDGRGRPHVLEVNPNPDVSRSAGLARAVAASGESYEAFVGRCVERAWARS